MCSRPGITSRWPPLAPRQQQLVAPVPSLKARRSARREPRPPARAGARVISPPPGARALTCEAGREGHWRGGALGGGGAAMGAM